MITEKNKGFFVTLLTFAFTLIACISVGSIFATVNNNVYATDTSVTTTLPADVSINYFVSIDNNGAKLANEDVSGGLLWLKSFDDSNIDGSAYWSARVDFSDSSYLTLYTGDYSYSNSASVEFVSGSTTTTLYHYSDGINNVAIRFGDNVVITKITYIGSGGNGLPDVYVDSSDTSPGWSSGAGSISNLNAFTFGYAPFNRVIETVTVYDPNSYESGYTLGYDKGYYDGKSAVENNIQSTLQAEYQRGYQAGVTAEQEDQNTIYQDGYNAGYTQGNTDGYSSGRQAGIAEVRPTAYQEGYNDGHRVGYDEGVAANNNDYSAGYADGVRNANEFTFFSLFGSMGDTVVTVFNNLLGFEFLGFPVLDFAKAIITFMLLIGIIRLIAGGAG